MSPGRKCRVHITLDATTVTETILTRAPLPAPDQLAEPLP